MQSFNPFTLENKVILVTGASSGIGRQCAIDCSKMGAKIILVARNETRLAETHSLMSSEQKHVILPIDLNDFDTVEEKLRTVKESGRIDGIIHCAGISTTLPLRMIKESHLNDFFKTNVESAVHLTKILTKPGYMNDEGASIVFMASVMGVVGEVGKTLYSLTKGALIAGAKSLALELAAKKIRVNSISPAVVATPMVERSAYSQDQDLFERVKSYHPLGLGKVEDVSNACIFLMSDASRWITGTNLIVDGGTLHVKKNTMKEVIIIGAGGHAAEIYEYIQFSPSQGKDALQIVGFIDDNPSNYANYRYAAPLLGNIKDHQIQKGKYYIIGIGNLQYRKPIVDQFIAQGAQFVGYIHPVAYISPSAKVGAGVVIAPYVNIGPNVVIGDFTLLNARCSIGHDSVLGQHNFISPNVSFSGFTKVGDENLFGVNSATIPGVSVGNRNKIAAGMVLDKSVDDDSVVFHRFKEKVIAIQKG